jgi:hypothetical protein
MKCLSNYTDQPISDLLTKYNGFFAFSTQQFQEAKKEGVKYVNRGAGLIHEAGKSKEFDAEYAQIISDAIKQDLADNGRDGIIERELANYEAYYTGEIEDTVEALKDYGITSKEVLNVFRKTAHKYDE